MFTVASYPMANTGMPRKSVSNGRAQINPLRILDISNESSFRESALAYLSSLEFKVDSVSTGCAGLQRANQNTWHAILLSDQVSDMHWLDVLKKLRSFTRVPIVVIASAPEHSSGIESFNLGADEYVSLTVAHDKLMARLRALIRRAGWAVHENPIPVVNEVVVGALRLGLGTYTAFFGDTVLDLTRTEFEVLLTLARSAGKACTRDELVESSKGGVWQVFDRGIDMHISALRRALGDESKEPRFIKTVRGVGYRLEISELGPAK